MTPIPTLARALRRTTAGLVLLLITTVALVVTPGTGDAATVVKSAAPAVAVAHDPSTAGYWVAASDGGVFAFGNAGFFGSMGGKPLNAPIVGLAATPSGHGYWLVASDGGIFAFGDAGFFGSMGGKPLNAPVVGIAATPSGAGYWLVAADGGIFAFGNAGFFGSMGGKPLNGPVAGIAATPSGAGYWLVASDGGIFAFGNAGFFGSMGGKPLNAPVVGIAATPSGAGYWLTAADGGIFAFGNAGFSGSAASTPLNAPVVGVTSTRDGGGYWLVASDGGVFAYGDATFSGRITYTPPTPSSSASTLAQQIIANSRIDKSGRLVLADLQDTAAGKVGTSGAPLSVTMLRMIVALAANHSLSISALESGGTGHHNGSLHYTGDAVDINRLDNQQVTGRNAPSHTIEQVFVTSMPSGSYFGQSNCVTQANPAFSLPAGIGQFNDTCDHLHTQVPRGAP